MKRLILRSPRHPTISFHSLPTINPTATYCASLPAHPDSLRLTHYSPVGALTLVLLQRVLVQRVLVTTDLPSWDLRTYTTHRGYPIGPAELRARSDYSQTASPLLSVLTYSLSLSLPLSPTLPTASTASSAAFMTPRRGSSALPGMSAIGFAVHQITGLLPPRVWRAIRKKKGEKNAAPRPMGCDTALK